MPKKEMDVFYMQDFIELNKGTYLLTSNNNLLETEFNINFIDIFNDFSISKAENSLLYIDFSKIKEQSEYKQIIKNIIKLKKKYGKKFSNIGIIKDNKTIIGIMKNYDSENKNHNDIVYSINAILFDNAKEMYEYIYDKICEYLDNEFINKNLCNFENDKCIAKRNTNCTMGCCHNFKSLFSNNLVVCKYLQNKTCSAHCLSCKLFTCDYLQKQGIQFKISDILLADCFFNIMQKLIIKASLFTTKEQIIKEIMFLRFSFL